MFLSCPKRLGYLVVAGDLAFGWNTCPYKKQVLQHIFLGKHAESKATLLVAGALTSGWDIEILLSVLLVMIAFKYYLWKPQADATLIDAGALASGREVKSLLHCELCNVGILLQETSPLKKNQR